jgi:hypothetical protein
MPYKLSYIYTFVCHCGKKKKAKLWDSPDFLHLSEEAPMCYLFLCSLGSFLLLLL